MNLNTANLTFINYFECLVTLKDIAFSFYVFFAKL